MYGLLICTYIYGSVCVCGDVQAKGIKKEREGEIKRKRMKMPVCVCVCEEMREMFNFVHEHTCNIMCCHNHDFVFFFLDFVAMRRAVNRRTSYPKDVLSE